VHVHRLTEAEFAAAGAWWDDLLTRSAADSFFLRHAWLSSWWRLFSEGRSLRALAVNDADGRLIGIAPWCLSRVDDHHGILPVGELAFLGREGVTGDYLDVIALPGREQDVLRACLDHLATDRRWDLLRVSDVAESSSTLANLHEEARARGFAAVPDRTQICPYLPLPATWDAFLASVSANMRSNLRRREKKLAALGAIIEEARGPALVPALDQLFELHGARWQTRGRTGNFVDPRLREFHRTLAPALDEEGRVGLWTLVMEDKPAAAIYGFRHRGRFLYYQAGFDPAFAEHGVGLALMGHAIRRSIECGLVEFDYLRGDEEYKRRWTNKTRLTRTLILARPSIRGLVWRTLLHGKATAKRFLKRTPAPTPQPAPVA
jgi:CelD/BcsL family acetyltransferase involved in cellulose biosynthesis